MPQSIHSTSKIVTIAICHCCSWFQDKNKIFKNKHTIHKPDSHCAACGRKTSKHLVRYHYRHLKALFGLIPYKKVVGFQSEEFERCGL